MSANKITNELLKILDKNPIYDFILLNFANCDLVGHSGDFSAAKKAVETIDNCLSKIIPKALEKNYKIILTSDHGNAEFMKYNTGEDCPAHTLNPVMAMLITKNEKSIKLKKGKNFGLKDIAPTVLKLLNLKKPKEMTGKSLL
jgi:2,3-bisphosphoglycerate-independent phosphoglycerate mutase